MIAIYCCPLSCHTIPSCQDRYSIVNDKDCGVDLQFERNVADPNFAGLRELVPPTNVGLESRVSRDDRLWVKAELEFLRNLAGTDSHK